MRKAYHSRLGHLEKQKRIGNICENRKDAELKNDKKEMMIEKKKGMLRRCRDEIGYRVVGKDVDRDITLSGGDTMSCITLNALSKVQYIRDSSR